MNKVKVLFVCIHNSARSQMAEAFLNQMAGDEFIAESAGIEPGNLNPLVVEVMKEVGIDISGNRTKSAFDFFSEGRQFQFVITVCDAASGERCPIFPGVTKRLSWSFNDPSSFTGAFEEKLTQTRLVRDSIKSEVEKFIKTYHSVNF
jgi:arsenate reductase (thioredoxin)